MTRAPHGERRNFVRTTGISLPVAKAPERRRLMKARERDAIVARLATESPEAVAADTGFTVGTITKLARVNGVGPGSGAHNRTNPRHLERNTNGRFTE